MHTHIYFFFFREGLEEEQFGQGVSHLVGSRASVPG